MTASDRPLSPRELVILRRLAEGLKGPEIALAESISLSTVKTHGEGIFRKLGTRTAGGTVHTAHLAGLLECRAEMAHLTPEAKLDLIALWLVDLDVVRAQLARERAAAAALEARP